MYIPEAKNVKTTQEELPTQSYQAIEHTFVVVELFHKQRGGKGVWNPIENGNFIRVTKNVGKKIKLIVKSAVKFDSNQIVVKLIDLEHPDMTDKEGRFSIETVVIRDNDIGGANAEYELKIFTLCKKLEYHCSIATSLGDFVGESICFGTHNSGKQRKKKDIIDNKTKKVLVPFTNKSNMNEKRKRFEMESVVPDMRNPKKYNDGRSMNMSSNNMNDFICALNTISLLHNQLYIYNAYPSLLNNFFEEAQMMFPEAIHKTTGVQESLSILHSDLLPIALKKVQIFEASNDIIDAVSKINPFVLQFSSERIRSEFRKYFDSIMKPMSFRNDNAHHNPSIYRNQQHFNTPRGYFNDEKIRPLFPNERNESIFPEEKNTFPLFEDKFHDKNLTKYERGLSQEMLETQAIEYGQNIIIPEGIRKGYRIAVALFRKKLCIDDFYLVLYKNNSLYSEKAVPIRDNCKYIFLESIDYCGIYCVVKFFSNPHITDSEFGDLLVLYDFRGEKHLQHTILCKPSNIGNQNLWVLGNFLISNESARWIVQVTENSNHHHSDQPVKHIQSPTPGTDPNISNFKKEYAENHQEKELIYQNFSKNDSVKEDNVFVN